MKCLEAQHGPCDAFDKPVILLNHIVEIFGLNNLDNLTSTREVENDVQLLKARQIGAALVDGDPVRYAIYNNGALEKASHRCSITTLRQHEIKGLAVTINSAVVIQPFSPHSRRSEWAVWILLL